MPYLLILLTLVFASCKSSKTNEISESAYKGTLEQRTFITIKHEEGESVIRNKILNTFVDEKYPAENPVNQINNRDELLGYKMDYRDMDSYSANEKKMAKVVVSYTDHLEIYYLPEGVPFEVIPSQLGLTPEANRIFKWVKSNYIKTSAGMNFYLASVNLDDIVKNDQRFFSETIEMKNEFAGKSIKLSAGKLLQYQVKYSTLQQDETSQGLQSVVRCNRDTRESGECGICNYARNTPAGSYSPVNVAVENLGLVVRISDRTFNVSSFNPVASGNTFNIDINAMEYELKKEVDVELVSTGLPGVVKYAPNFGHNGYCPNTGGGVEIGLARTLNVEVIVNVKGRGSEVLKYVL